MLKSLQTPWISIKENHLAQKHSKAEIQAGAKEYVALEEVRAGAKEFTDAGLKIQERRAILDAEELGAMGAVSFLL